MYVYGGDDIIHDEGGNDVYLLPYESWGRTEITDIGGVGTILSGIIPIRGEICLIDNQCAVLDYSNGDIRASAQFCLFMEEHDLIILTIENVLNSYRQGHQATLPDTNTVEDYLRIKNFQTGDFGITIMCTTQQKQQQQYINSNNANVCSGSATSCAVTPDYEATQLNVPLGKQVDIHNNVVPTNRKYVLNPSSTTKSRITTLAVSSPYVNVFGVRDGDTVEAGSSDVVITQDGTSCKWTDEGTQVQLLSDYHGDSEIIECSLKGNIISVTSSPLPSVPWDTPEPSSGDANMTVSPPTSSPTLVSDKDTDSSSSSSTVLNVIIIGSVLGLIGLYFYYKRRTTKRNTACAEFDTFSSKSDNLPLHEFDPVRRPSVTLHRI